MTLEVLISCMHQEDGSLLKQSRISGDAVIINQCDEIAYREYKTEQSCGRMFCTTQRGLTKSRNMAIQNARADVCLLCDDDEIFVQDYEHKILTAYEALPQADVVIFKMVNRPPSFPDRVMPIRFPKTMKVSSWQISFRRQRLLDSGVRFDELLGAGTGNGAEEELKFLLDCQRMGLKIYYVPAEIATVGQEQSTWFSGFTEEFFENRGATTRYILGLVPAVAYAVYYVIRKNRLYRGQITPAKALSATLRGIRENKIRKQQRKSEELK